MVRDPPRPKIFFSFGLGLSLVTNLAWENQVFAGLLVDRSTYSRNTDAKCPADVSQNCVVAPLRLVHAELYVYFLSCPLFPHKYKHMFITLFKASVIYKRKQ